MASFFDRLEQRCRAVDSLLCVGLDPHRQDLEKIGDYSPEGAFNFSKNLIDQTKHVAVAYKPNAAFFEALGADGVRALERGEYSLCFDITFAAFDSIHIFFKSKHLPITTNLPLLLSLLVSLPLHLSWQRSSVTSLSHENVCGA